MPSNKNELNMPNWSMVVRAPIWVRKSLSSLSLRFATEEFCTRFLTKLPRTTCQIIFKLYSAIGLLRISKTKRRFWKIYVNCQRSFGCWLFWGHHQELNQCCWRTIQHRRTCWRGWEEKSVWFGTICTKKVCKSTLRFTWKVNPSRLLVVVGCLWGHHQEHNQRLLWLFWLCARFGT